MVDETDDDEIWPDANIGFDSFRFGVRPPVVVPGGATRFDPTWGPAAAVPGVDHTAGSGSVTFAPGETAKSVSILVVGDTAAESDELLAVSFRNPVNAVVGGYWGLGFGGIADDD